MTDTLTVSTPLELPDAATMQAQINARRKAKWTPEKRKMAGKASKKNWAVHRIEILRANRDNRKANAVRELRFLLAESLGGSQEEFGRALGLSDKCQARVSRWENGLRPSNRFLKAMDDLAKKHGVFWTYWEAKSESEMEDAMEARR